MITYEEYIQSAQEDERMTKAFQANINAAIADKIAKGLPVARYDAETDRSYLEYPDGHREYVGYAE